MDIDALRNRYVLKLFNIWKRFGGVIILVDFDDTIRYYNVTPIELCNDVVNTIKEAQEFGASLVLWTCRDGEELTEALEYCNSIGLTFDAVNPTKSEVISNTSNKAFGNIQLDDRAGLYESLTILKLALNKYKMYLYEINNK